MLPLGRCGNWNSIEVLAPSISFDDALLSIL
jgi:hypothetical protein